MGAAGTALSVASGASGAAVSGVAAIAGPVLNCSGFTCSGLTWSAGSSAAPGFRSGRGAGLGVFVCVMAPAQCGSSRYANAVRAAFAALTGFTQDSSLPVWSPGAQEYCPATEPAATQPRGA